MYSIERSLANDFYTLHKYDEEVHLCNSWPLFPISDTFATSDVGLLSC